MGRVWSEAHKYELWCRVETIVLEAHAAAGHRAGRRGRAGAQRAAADPEAVAEIEAVTQHDVIAFLTAWADNTDAARGRRLGALRHDVVRPARHRAGAAAGRGHRLLLAKADRLVAALRDHALRTATRCGSAAPTASTPSPTCGATGSPTSRSRWRGHATGCGGPARRSASPRSPARSAPTPTSTRRSSSTSPPRSGCGRPTSPPRS